MGKFKNDRTILLQSVYGKNKEFMKILPNKTYDPRKRKRYIVL